jgi:hypothetical protein
MEGERLRVTTAVPLRADKIFASAFSIPL